MPILTLRQLDRIEAGRSHRAFGSHNLGCGCQECMGSAVTQPSNIVVPPDLKSQWMTDCYNSYRSNPSNNLMTDAIINKYCNQSVSIKVQDYQAQQAQGANNANVVAAQTVAKTTQAVVGQTNLDLFGQILKNYSGALSPSDRDLLNNFFTNWHQPLSPDQVTQVTQIMKNLVGNGANIVPSSAVQSAIKSLQAMLPQAQLPDLSLAFSDPTAFYNQVLLSTHTIITSAINTLAANYLPPTPGGSMPSTSIPNSQGLTASDWQGAQANQAVTTDMQNSNYTSPLNTLYLPQTTQQATAAAVADTSSAAPSPQSNIPLLLGAVVLGYILLKGD